MGPPRNQDSLTTEELRRLLRILESIAEARTVQAFQDRLTATVRAELSLEVTLTVVADRQPSRTTIYLETGLPRVGRLTLPASRKARALLPQLRVLALHLAPLLRINLEAEEGSLAAQSLTPREAEVARRAAEGWSNRRIATDLSISEDTVKKHLTHSFAKVGVKTRTQLAVTLRAPASRSLSP